jgi:hypothetical protein
MQAAQFKVNLILNYSIYIPNLHIIYRFVQVRTSSQNHWPLQTFNRTIGPVLPWAQTLDPTMVRFCLVQVQTTVPNWTLPSTADCAQYKITAYVAPISGHILNIQNNKQIPHIYCNISSLPIHLRACYIYAQYASSAYLFLQVSAREIF